MDIGLLPYKATRAIIINCSTKYFSTLALASALKYTDADILLIDCHSTDGSFEHFSNLQRRHAQRVELVQLPLRPHGITLDHIFRSIRSDYVLLIDSDLEILDAAVVQSMSSAIRSPGVYGAGLLHAAQWMSRSDHGIADGTTYFMERMWIPLTLLDAGKVREILNSGCSFLAERKLRAGALPPALASKLSMRFRLPLLRNFPSLLSTHRMDCANPCVAEYDTGAIVHQSAKSSGYLFAEIAFPFWNSVHHFDGVTRATHANSLRGALTRLGILSSKLANNLSASENVAMERLREKYPEFLQHPHA